MHWNDATKTSLRSRLVVTTAVGTQTLAVPRWRIVEPNGSTSEFRSQALPRYARRTREVDEGLLGA